MGLRVGNKIKHFKVIPDDMIMKEAEITLSKNAHRLWALMKLKILDNIELAPREWVLKDEGFLSIRKSAEILNLSRKTTSKLYKELKKHNMISYGSKKKEYTLSDGTTFCVVETYVKINTDPTTWNLLTDGNALRTKCPIGTGTPYAQMAPIY